MTRKQTPVKFRKYIENLCSKQSKRQVAIDLELNPVTIFRYLRGETYPDAATIERVAKHAGVSPSWFFEDDDSEDLDLLARVFGKDPKKLMAAMAIYRGDDDFAEKVCRM